MKEISTYIIERKLRHDDLPWLTKECLHDAVDLWYRNFRNLLTDDFMIEFNLTKREVDILTALLSWCDSGVDYRGDLQDIDLLYNYIEKINKRRLDTFISAGGEGAVFDCGNYIIKLFTLNEGEGQCYKLYRDYIRKWAEKSKDLRVIPPLIRYDKKDWRWIVIEKFTVPCPEGKLLVDAMSILGYADCEEWTNVEISTFKKRFTRDQQKFILKWLEDYCHDYRMIMGDDAIINDDIRIKNIGKDKHGNVVIFDWQDVFNC